MSFFKEFSCKVPLSDIEYTLFAHKRYSNKIIGCNKSLCLVLCENNNYQVYYLNSETIKSNEEGKNIIGNNDIIQQYIEEIDMVLNKMKLFWNDILIHNISRNQLAELFKSSSDLMIHYTALYQLSSNQFCDGVWKDLNKSISNVPNKSNIISALTSTNMMQLFEIQEIENWIKICNYRINEVDGKIVEQMIKKHSKEYSFLHLPYETFENKIINYYKAKLQKETVDSVNILYQKFKTLKIKSEYSDKWAKLCANKIKLTSEQLITARNLARLSLYRLKMREISTRFLMECEEKIMNPIYKIISDKDGKYIFDLLTTEEIIGILLNNYQENYIELIKNRNKFIYIYENNELCFYDDPKTFEMFLKKTKNISKSKSKTLPGVVVYGEDKILSPITIYDRTSFDKKDSNQLLVDDRVIVAQTIHSNILHECLKAKAIITEEGGITSHASVICKEFGIPCMVGVRGILSLINEKDLVYIDMDNEEVTIISNEDAINYSIIKNNEKENEEQQKTHNNLINISDDEANDILNVGGKARNLYLINQWVPHGFILTINGALDFEKNYTIGNIHSSQIGKNIINKINCMDSRNLAIRSSYCFEDSKTHSYAGIFKSYVNINSDDNQLIFDSIYNVIKSKENATNINNKDILINNSNMAVIIQKMIAPYVSGVAFTDVLYKNSHYIVIEYTYGDLFSIMNGEIRPEKVYIDKQDFIINELSFVDSSYPPFFDQSINYEIELLGKRLLHLENLFGYKQEVEWLIDVDKKLWILQSRPITT